MKNFVIFFYFLFSQHTFAAVTTVCNDFGSDGKSLYSIVIETTENFGTYLAHINEKATSTKTQYEVTRQVFRTSEHRQPDSIIFFAKNMENQIGFKLAINTSKILEYETYSSLLSTNLESGYLLRHMECNFFYKQPRDISSN